MMAGPSLMIRSILKVAVIVSSLNPTSWMTLPSRYLPFRKLKMTIIQHGIHRLTGMGFFMSG